MTSTADERYQRAQAIVHEVLEYPASERVARIDATCADDTPLRREVEWLIASAEISSPDGSLTDVGAIAQALLAHARIEAVAPHKYRLLERLGEGGMGQVWLAERDDGTTQQRIALKMLRSAGTPSDAELARFVAEGRILAALSHPNIAHLLDTGCGADSEPFLAMEYVDGGRIDRWCDTRALGLRERVELFLKVCAAVEYAHAQLVIHRDLKPANILVTAAGEPKLLDFGIARLLDANAGATHATTVLRAMTLAYASPEQIEGSALGTATDIYSLGVVLYELVAGVRPFDHIGTEHARSNAIVSGDITPPSRQVQAAPEATQGEQRTPRGLARRIPADIDAIVLKALRREPAQRYASVGEFADDLRRHLAAQPVLARRGDWTYRAQRFIWRNRWPLAAAVVLAALVSGFTWRTLLAEHEAHVQAATSDRVAEFLVSVFAASDSNLSSGVLHELTAREVLDAGTVRIGTELHDQPRIRARLIEAVGNAYRHMNASTKAAKLMREAADLNLAPSVDQPLAAARCLEALANIMANGEFPASDAERAARESLNLSERLTAPGSQPIANAWMVLSLALNRAGQFASAQEAAEKSLQMNQRLAPHVDNRLAASLHNLCIITLNRGDTAASKGYCEKTLAMRDDESVSESMTLSRYAQVLSRGGDAEGANDAIEHALRIVRTIEGEHSEFGAVYLLRQAHIFDDAGRYDAALPLLQRALADEEQLNGKDSGESINVLLEIARRHLLIGEADRALPLLRRIVELRGQRYEAQDPRVLCAKTLLAMTLLDMGHADAEARTLLDQASAGWATKDDPGAIDAPYTPLALAQWFVMNGDLGQAESLLDRIEAPDAKGDVWVRAHASVLRASIGRRRGDAPTALRDEESAWQQLHDAAGALHPQTARIGLSFARDLRAAGRTTQAEELEKELRPVFERAFPADSTFSTF